MRPLIACFKLALVTQSLLGYASSVTFFITVPYMDICA